MTYVKKKSGQIRISLDPKDLNRAIQRPHHAAKTLDDVNYLLCGSTVFSKLDACSGYWSVVLDYPSSLLTTFNTHMGRFRFNRLPFELSISQDVFQQQMDTMLQNMEGIINIADDIIVFGTDQETHDKNLEALMIQAEKYGLVFNATKCNISKDKVSFFGQLYNKDGIRAYPDRTRAIAQMQTPTTVAELRSFIGIASYMSPFINNMSELLTPLRELKHKDIHFDWTSSHEQRFIQIKNMLCRTTSLAYYDPTLPTVIQVDASGNGLGAVLLQNERPICFASRTLTIIDK